MKHISSLLYVLISISFMTNITVGKDDGPRDLRVSLLGPNKVVQGDPVSLTVRINNTTKLRRNFVVPEIKRFGPETALFRVASTNAATFESVQYPDIYVGGMKSLSPRPLRVQQLESGMTAEFIFTLMYDFPTAKKRKQLFRRPGIYNIEITVFEPKNEPQNPTEMPYDGDKTPITSEPLSVEIVPPDNAQDKAAFAKLQELPDEYLLYAPEMFKPDCHAEAIQRMSDYFREFSATRYGRYCALPLGMAVSNGATNIDREKIKTILQSAMQEKDFPLYREAAVVLEKVKRSELH